MAPESAPPGPRLGWRGALGVLAAALVADLALLLLAPADAETGVWWSVVGLQVGALLESPRRRWPALLLVVAATGAVSLLARGTDPTTLSVGVLVVVVQAVLGAALLAHGTTRLLRTPGDVARLAGAALAVGAVAAAGLGLAAGLGSAPAGAAQLVGALTAAAVSVAVLTTPVVLLPQRSAAPHPWALLGAHALLVGLGVWLTLGPDPVAPLPFLSLALLGLGAFLFDLAVTSLELAVLSGVVVALAARGNGPVGDMLAAGDLTWVEAAAWTQAYCLAGALVVLPLGVAVRQQQRLRQRVDAEESQQRLTFEHSTVGMLLVSRATEGEAAGRLVVDDLNSAAAGALGLDRATAVGRQVLELLAVQGATPVIRDGLLDGEPVWRGRCSVVARPGSLLDVVVASRSAGENPRLGEGFTLQLVDIGLEAAAAERADRARQLTEATIDTAGCVIVVTDERGLVLRVNAATEQITGHLPTSLLGRPIWETPVSPSGRADLESLLAWPNRSGLPVVRESTIRAADGRELRLIWSSNVVAAHDGQPAYCVITGVDVSAERASTTLVTHLMQASIATALVGTDPQGNVSVLNSGAERLLGLTSDAAAGRPVTAFLDPAEVEQRCPGGFVACAAAMAAGSESETQDWTWVGDDGTRHVVAMTVSPTADATGRLGYLLVAQDVTERQAGHAALAAALDKERAAVEQLRSLDRARDELVSTVSHELRTPVTSILGYTELLREGAIVPPDPAQVPLLDTITRGSHRLIDICNDLLLLSGLEAGAISLTMQPLDLRETVRTAVEGSEPLLAGRHLQVEVEQPEHPVEVRGDAHQLERAVANLLGNAVKFTSDGGRVVVTLAREGTEALVAVSDTGIGIPLADQEAVFTRFFRTDEAQHQAIPGTGLGLSIVADIVHAHQGRVELESAPGSGTTVLVRLPADHPDPA
ncbi:ATP-binding protein [Nocardioides nanhaiensis]|uniref:ATP-binding protein n=1 Tax=Nocardioides nanhaiensis TaxID=1476871 RepID=UPI0031EB74E7